MARGNLSRRGLLKGALALGGGGLIVAAAGGEVLAASSKLAAKNTPTPFTNMFRRPPVLMPVAEGVDDKGPWQRFRLTQKLGQASIVPGLTTTIAGYNGIFPGPTIRVNQGTRTEVRIANALTVQRLNGLPFSTVTHLHGSASLPQYDGYANDQTKPGYCKTYKYPNWQQARTLWYHDHNHRDTAQNVFSGLAAQYHLTRPVRAGPAAPGRVRRAADRQRHVVQRGRLARLRRLRARRLHGRRHPGQRRAVAQDEGQAAGVPVPGAGGRHLPVVPVHAQHRRPDLRGGQRRRHDAQGHRGARPGGTAWPSATRCSSTSGSTRSAPRSSCGT